MKKTLVVFLITITFLIGNTYVISKKEYNIDNNNEEIRGIYISYLEYLSYFQNNNIDVNKSYINKMLDQIKDNKFNNIFLHVSPFSDSIYKSNIFPYSYTLTGTEGKDPGMDYLDYFIKESHLRNIKVHAWINPYRISNTTDINKLSNNNPAITFLKTGDAKITKTGIYYNPSSSKVIDLLIKQIYEIITNYEVDGIHLDDYFYEDLEIDLENYQRYFLNNNISLEEYRYNIINTTIKTIYKLIKDYNKNIIFSIAPDGNIENNYQLHFADVKQWLKENNYVDIIMPQVYYGFNNNLKPFEKTINEWNNLITNNVKIVPVLAFYKVGLEDTYAGNGKYEWVNNKDIIAKQIIYSKTLNHYQGFTLFRYEYLFNENLFNNNTKEELNNVLNLTK